MKDDTEDDYGCDHCGKNFDTPLAAAVHEKDNCKENPEVAA